MITKVSFSELLVVSTELYICYIDLTSRDKHITVASAFQQVSPGSCMSAQTRQEVLPLGQKVRWLFSTAERIYFDLNFGRHVVENYCAISEWLMVIFVESADFYRA